MDLSLPCIYHPGKLRPTGYGRASLNGRTEYAHRVAWIVRFGPIPAGMTVDHSCHNADSSCSGGSSCRHRACINVEHLELVDAVENARRASIYARTGHCKHGHDLAVVGVYEVAGRKPFCRRCHLDRQSRYDALTRHKSDSLIT